MPAARDIRTYLFLWMQLFIVDIMHVNKIYMQSLEW